jgi:hypothetical protein
MMKAYCFQHCIVAVVAVLAVMAVVVSDIVVSVEAQSILLYDDGADVDLFDVVSSRQGDGVGEVEDVPTPSPTVPDIDVTPFPTVKGDDDDDDDGSDAPSVTPSTIISSSPSSSSSSDVPSDVPSLIPSDGPSMVPSDVPSVVPSDGPSMVPSEVPTTAPSSASSSTTTPSPSTTMSPSSSTTPLFEDPICQSNPTCNALNLTGLCCPTTEGVNLDCCFGITPLPTTSPSPSSSEETDDGDSRRMKKRTLLRH